VIENARACILLNQKLMLGITGLVADLSLLLQARSTRAPINNAIKNLTDQELDQLYLAVLTELQRRGRKLP
jgi:hypothetical protein